MLKEMVKLFKHEVLDDPNFSSTLSSSPQTHAFCILLFSLEKTQPLQPLDSSKSKISPHKTHNAFTHTPIFSIPIPTLHAEASQSSSPCGEVHVIAGPMFAGKTTTLLRRIQAESNNAREHPAIWSALLGACRIHGDMNLVKLAADKYFELDPENIGKYVVLSNAYATFGFWENVAALRRIMRNSGVIKESAYSRIEIQGEVHFFLRGDTSHKLSAETYKLIKLMTCILKDSGYVPDISGT